MTDLGLLYAMAVIDGMFVGYRDAMGRNPLLDKRRYYLRAMLLGIGLVHIALVAIAAAVGLSLWLSGDPAHIVSSLEQVADTMRTVYLGFAGTVALVFCVYALPFYDLRSYVTVSAFGMLTLIRPFVIVAGAVVGGLGTGEPLAWLTCAVVAGTMATLQPGLSWLGWNRFDWSSIDTSEVLR